MLGGVRLLGQCGTGFGGSTIQYMQLLALGQCGTGFGGSTIQYMQLLAWNQFKFNGQYNKRILYLILFIDLSVPDIVTII